PERTTNEAIRDKTERRAGYRIAIEPPDRRCIRCILDPQGKGRFFLGYRGATNCPSLSTPGALDSPHSAREDLLEDCVCGGNEAGVRFASGGSEAARIQVAGVDAILAQRHYHFSSSVPSF